MRINILIWVFVLILINGIDSKVLIIKLSDEYTNTSLHRENIFQKELAILSNIQIKQEFQQLFQGYSIDIADFLTPEQENIIISLLKNIKGVSEIFHDLEMTLENQFITENLPSSAWALDRISKENSDIYNNQFTYHESAGNAITAWVVDSGIDVNHEEFEGRANQVKTCVGSNTDENGHGTHVAGIIGGKKYGVAKKITLNGVKVIDRNAGAVSGVICGLEYVLEEIRKRGSNEKHVINLSLGIGFFDNTTRLFESALIKVADEPNVLIFAASGNQAINACNRTPARIRHPKLFTVTSNDYDGSLSDFSNLGPCVHLSAPGNQINSAKNGGGFTFKSGTSMASPLVAGVAALHLSNGRSISTTLDYLKTSSENIENNPFPILQYRDCLTSNTNCCNYNVSGCPIPAKNIGSDPTQTLIKNQTPPKNTNSKNQIKSENGNSQTIALATSIPAAIIFCGLIAGSAFYIRKKRTDSPKNLSNSKRNSGSLQIKIPQNGISPSTSSATARNNSARYRSPKRKLSVLV